MVDADVHARAVELVDHAVEEAPQGASLRSDEDHRARVLPRGVPDGRECARQLDAAGFERLGTGVDDARTEVDRPPREERDRDAARRHADRGPVAGQQCDERLHAGDGDEGGDDDPPLERVRAWLVRTRDGEHRDREEGRRQRGCPPVPPVVGAPCPERGDQQQQCGGEQPHE